MRRPAAPSKAARSASESQLRSNATSYLNQKSNRYSTAARAILGAAVGAEIKKRNKKETDKSRGKINKTSKKSKKNTDDFDYSNVEDAVIVTDSPKSRQFSPRAIGAPPPKAIGAPPKKKPSTKKKSSGPKRERKNTQSVFVAHPVVDLESPTPKINYSHIEKSEQPKPPRKTRRKNAPEA